MPTVTLERILICVFLIYPSRFFVAATIDGSHLEYSSNQERVWVNNGDVETVVAYFFYSLIVMMLLYHFYRTSKYFKVSPLFLSIFFFYGLGLIFNYTNWPRTEIMGIFVFFLILLAVSGSSFTFALIFKIRFFQTLVLLVICIFPFINYSRSFTKCTIDKCSIIGKLFTSFFPHENALALFLFIGSILYFNKKSFFNIFMVSLHGILIVMTGSRLVIIIFFVLLLCTFLKPIAMYFAIWVVAVAAGVLYFTLMNPASLTGRGLIFLIGRNIFFENPLFGFGFGALTEAHSKWDLIGYGVSHEHNGIGVILIRHGLVGGLAFVFYLAKIGKDISRKSKTQMLLLLGLVLTFPTEAASDFTLQNYLSWVYLVALVSLVKEDNSNSCDTS